MRSFVLVTCFLFAGLMAFCQDIHYTLSMPEPQTHYFEVELNFRSENRTQEIYMPAWTPGSYKIRDFSRNIEDIKGWSGDKTLEILKITKNSWKINDAKGDIRITYRVYAYENSVRTSYIDDSHGYINGASAFLVPSEMENLPVNLSIKPYSGWKNISTGLTEISDFEFTAKDYHQLIDSPVEIGNHSRYFFIRDDVNYEVAIYGKSETEHEEWVKATQEIVSAANQLMGVVPVKKYVFIIHTQVKATGGLEHSNSTMIQVNRWTYEKPLGVYGYIAHEYFHLWNAKRIKPAGWNELDYNRENYTSLLWVMEGFTSYYENLILLRADLMDFQTFLNKTASTIGYVESLPGNKVQSLAEASFDAWIKFYNPDENSPNTTVSYYSKGKVIAMLLDLKIIEFTQGEKNLDDLMRLLYHDYFEKDDSGITELQLIQACNTITGTDMDPFFDSYVRGTSSPDYASFFNTVGFQASLRKADDPDMGTRTAMENGRLMVKSVTRGGTAYEGGLSAGDEIIAINNYRITGSEMESLLNNSRTGDTLDIVLSRDGLIRKLDLVLLKSTIKRINISPKPNLQKEMKRNFKKWVRSNDKS